MSSVKIGTNERNSVMSENAVGMLRAPLHRFIEEAETKLKLKLKKSQNTS